MIIEKNPPFKNGMPPIHPGEYIAEDLEEWGMTAAEFDAALAVPVGTTASLVAEHLSITPELALRLSCYMCTSAELWLGLQASYDLKVVAHKHGLTIAAQVRPLVDYGSIPYGVSGVSEATDGDSQFR